MASRFDLCVRALQEITVLAAGEDPTAEDLELAEHKFDAVHASLGARSLLTWTLDSIPDWAEEPLVQMTASILGKPFGMANDDAAWATGEAEIRRIVQIDNNNAVTQSESF